MEWKADFDRDQEEPTSVCVTSSASPIDASTLEQRSAQPPKTAFQEDDRKPASRMEDAEEPIANNSSADNSTPVTTNNNSNTAAPTDDEDEKEDKFSKYLFCFASFHAVFAPVCICMIMSALVVIYINTDATRAAGEAALSQSYEVFELQEGNGQQNFLASIGNTLIIIGVICAMTFVVVLLYKFRCLKIFYGYMILVTTMLLGYFTTNILLIAIRKYNIPVDWPSLIFIMYNFAIVGTLSIFYSKGIPTFVTQGYLICTSVVLAWQLSFFGTWTAWTLLVALALYDLFAVLTPCGPLRKLAELMSEADAPAIPGLLYEAALPNSVQRPNSKAKAEARASQQHGKENEQPPDDSAVTANNSASDDSDDERKKSALEVNHSNSAAARSSTSASNQQAVGSKMQSQPSTRASKRSNDESTSRSTTHEVRYGKIPLSLAMVYKLQIIDEEGILLPKEKKSLFARSKKGEYQNSDDQEIVEYSGLELRERKDLTPRQLKAPVKVAYPHRGGWIDPGEGDGYWNVYNRSGELMREFVIDDVSGKVFQKGEARRTTRAIEDNTIKLGLGDFIFYSVLVSKAALNGFTSFAMCMLVILVGLCITLLLLSVYGKALPALPISIFLGVAFFFLSTAIVDPWLDSLIRIPLYV
ncbi:MAG: hypothetical protein SGBAC_005539 [Bacillariaceae sp.]